MYLNKESDLYYLKQIKQRIYSLVLHKEEMQHMYWQSHALVISMMVLLF